MNKVIIFGFLACAVLAGLSGCAGSQVQVSTADRLALEKDAVTAICQKAESTGELAKLPVELQDVCAAFGVPVHE